MNPFKSFPSDTTHIEKSDGNVVGPYKATFASDTIVIWDEKADIEEGDIIFRTLPNGNDERSLVTKANFYQKMHSIPAHYQLKYIKEKAAKMGSSQHGNISIGNAHNVQIGNNNTQHIVNSIQSLVKQIESSTGTPPEKEEAKKLLSNFIKHPLVASILGAAAGTLLG